MRIKYTSKITITLLFLLLSFSVFATSLTPSEGTIPGSYVVIFKSKMTPESMNLSKENRINVVESKINQLKDSYQFDVKFKYGSCLQGFSAKMDENTAVAMAHDPRVESIELDRVAHANLQTIPAGIIRIGGTRSSTISGNGSGTVSGVDIFIIDTGIQSNHPDLNVVGGANFNDGGSFEDLNGHGTFVAGVAAAIDNTSYIVGVAPGANLYAVRVLNASGSGAFSQVLAGVDWVTLQKLANRSRPMVANLSLGAYVGTTRYNFLDYGIRNSISAGVVYSLAAGNGPNNAAYFSPAHTTEALTVGAYNASNNTWASFSNYGSVIDILAPGVNVLSTYMGSSMAYISGTSASAPHVAGTAALYLSRNPGKTPSQVRSALINASVNPRPGPNPLIRNVREGTTNRSVYTGNF